MQKQLLLDLTERSAWTGAQASLRLAATELADIPVWWAAPEALVLATAKAWVAGRLGRKSTASTLPAAADPPSLARGV
ncbi:hypothetical protein [Streptomyces sp. NBC_01320]|uniref:hypothetical protein n=1 Tax=Streptomyces sp. NBC_01320 TaxID=2903824 RepID=UPI002E10165A|nr:hypothetical protein OG395_06215 [Streptomyces sp. NBC_01320]